MFADALLDSHHQSRRGWATVTSFGVQAILIACLLIIPLFYTQVLPQMRESSHTYIVPFGSPVVRQLAPTQPTRGRPSVFTVARPDVIMAPRIVPRGIDSSPGVDAPNFPIGDADPSRIGVGLPVGVWHSLDQLAVHRTPPQPVATIPPRRSVMMEGSLIRKVDPVYPSLARAARVQGSVILAAVIGRDGSVQHLQIVRGHPLLTTAAIDAVRQWRYRPYVLNGETIEVDTQVTVNFILAR